MNKMMKGSIAGAAGIALLMGGFGTYALWSDTGTVEDSEITSGVLDVEAGTAAWADQNSAVWNPASDRMVPGDTVTRTQEFTFSATGKNMAGTIRFTPGAETEQSTGSGDDFTVGVAVSGLTGVTGSGGCYEFTAPLGSPLSVDTTVTYALTADAQDLQDVTASLADSTFVIEQGDTCS